MTAEDDNAPGDSGAARPRKAPLTIDLAATSRAAASSEATAPAAEDAADEARSAAAAGAAGASGEVAPAGDGRRGGWTGLVVAGLVGGVIATALGIAYHASGIVPSRAEIAAEKAATEAAAATAAATAAAGALAGLGERVAGLEARPGAATTAEVKALGDKATALDTALAGLAARVGALEARPAAPAVDGAAPGIDPAAIAGIEARLARLEAGAAAVAGLDGRVAAVEAEVKALSARVETLAAEPAAATEGARAIALALVRQAADGGKPFAAELAALSGLGLDETALAGLRPLAEKGAPGLAALQADFPGVADAILDALDVPGPDAGILDRIAAYGRGLVSIRPTEAIPGDTPVAVVSRMQIAVDRGDLAAALAERSTLPEAGQAASAAWAAAAADRVAIEAALAGRAGPAGGK